MLSEIFGSRVMAGLTTMFNFLALNLILLIVSLPVITLPWAVTAATVALERWRAEGDDRVVRSFFLALRARPFGRTTLLVGGPLAAVAVGVVEIHHFLDDAGLVSRIAMGSGAVALLVTLVSLGYVFQLAARGVEDSPAADFWSLCVRLGVGNLFRTGPLFLLEIAAATALIVIDPPLAAIGLPLFLLQLMRLTAQSGLRRIQQ
jgi:hypothetical protein